MQRGLKILVGAVNDDKVKAHVHEQAPVSIGRRQPSTHGLVNGQDSNEQVMRQTIPMHTSNAGCFGGGSVFQAMIRPSPGLHGFMSDNAYGAMQAGINNPMYGNIGVQPGFQYAAVSYGMAGVNMGMAGFSQPYAQYMDMTGRTGGNFGSGMPLLNAPVYDNLMPKGKPRITRKEDKQSSLTPSTEQDKLKALLFLQQFDGAFAGGNFTKSSKIRKAATFLKTNTLQWWTSLLNQGVVPSTWVEFKHVCTSIDHRYFRESIVRDKDPHMTSLFWKALFENMGTTLKFSSSFHPQTDGQSEEANSIALDLLKCYVSKHKATWEHYQPMVEYAYNNTVHTSTGKAPFEIVEGGKKVPPILQTKDKIFAADKYVQNTDQAYRKIKLTLEKTQSKQKKAVDRHRRELIFSLGDWILLCFEKAMLRKIKGKERLFPKLGMRYYGPFQVCDKISDVAYSLKLPEGWKIHNASM
ncbi:hypothetical protein L7F22_033360 [Adiantum nelumboides]|nr:hypothetical protein [Adiantum nelumboides]